MVPCLCIIRAWYYEDEIIHGTYVVSIVHMTVFITNFFIGENQSHCSIYPATVRHAGHYYCEVKNQYGVENSATAIVSVSTSPTTNIPSGTSGFSYAQLPLKGLASQTQDYISPNLLGWQLKCTHIAS